MIKGKVRKVPTSVNKETGEKYPNFSYMLLSDATKKLNKLSYQKQPRSTRKKLLLTLLRIRIIAELITFEVTYTISSTTDFIRRSYKLITKYLPQRLRRGFSDKELWSLDYSIVDFITKYLEPRILGFKSMKRYGYPAYLNSEQEWMNILNEIHQGFLIIKREGVIDPCGLTEEETKQVSRSIELFSKHWVNLWD